MEIIEFNDKMDLSSKKKGDTFGLKINGEVFNIRVDEDVENNDSCKTCVFWDGKDCMTSVDQDWCVKYGIVYHRNKNVIDYFEMKDAKFLWGKMSEIKAIKDELKRIQGELPKILSESLEEIISGIDEFVKSKVGV